MDDKNNIEKELAELSPILAKMQKEKDGFNVPYGYFDTLPNKVFDAIKQPAKASQPKTSDWLNWVYMLLRPRIAMGFGMILLLIGTGIFCYNHDFMTTSTKDNLVSLSADEINNYIEKNQTDFDEDLIYENIETAHLSYLEEMNQNDLDNKEIEDYLQNNLDDEDETLLEEVL